MKKYIWIHSFITIIITATLVSGCKKNSTTTNNVRLASLNTDVTNITKISAKFGSTISSDGGATITSKGFCYSTSPNPTTTSNNIAGVGTDNMYATVSGLASNTTYYVKSYAINSAGTAYGEQETFTTLAPYSIGESYGGGIIFYIDASGVHGLVRASSDLGSTNVVAWGCGGINIPGTSTSIGSGQANTTAIVNACSTPGIAARLCDDLVLNGFSDWFLPSRDEFLELCHTLNISTSRYWWTSSQVNINNSHISGVDCIAGSNGQSKNLPEWVWPVRKF